MITLFFKRAKLFIDTSTGAERTFAAGTGLNQRVPEWIQHTPGYAEGVADGSIKDVSHAHASVIAEPKPPADVEPKPPADVEPKPVVDDDDPGPQDKDDNLDGEDEEPEAKPKAKDDESEAKAKTPKPPAAKKAK